jgi:transposase
MRQVHRAREKLFTDFAGLKPHWIDPDTGAAHEAELFVAVLGASNLSTPRRWRANASRTGSPPTRAPWSTAPACRRRSCPIS